MRQSKAGSRMTPLSSVNASALFVLQQVGATSHSPAANTTPGSQLIATANGNSSHATTSALGNSTQARSKIDSALFGSTAVDPTAMKVHLMERLGEKFGISMDDFASPRDFGTAIKEAVGQLKLRDGAAAIVALEKDLGLDELGISLDTLVGAIMDTGGKDDQKLDAALRKKAGLDADASKDAGSRSTVVRLRSDAIGLYCP